MPPSESTLSYNDVRAVCDRALANGRGLNITCNDLSEAHSLRFRIYAMRNLDRAANSRTYAADHPMHGKSVYDQLMLTPRQKEDDSYCLTILVSSPEALEERIEEL